MSDSEPQLAKHPDSAQNARAGVLSVTADFGNRSESIQFLSATLNLAMPSGTAGFVKRLSANTAPSKEVNVRP